jgi:hypothetical protein
VALQPFVGLWLFSFLIFSHNRQDPFDGGSARRKDATCTQDNTNTGKTNTDIHISSGILTHNPSVLSGPQSGHCDRQICLLLGGNTNYELRFSFVSAFLYRSNSFPQQFQIHAFRSPPKQKTKYHSHMKERLRLQC